MLGAIVVQSVRRASESEALLTSLDASLIEPINSSEFHFYVQNQIAKAKRFVAETTLHQTIVYRKEFHHPDDLPKTDYASTLYKRIQKEEITCWVIETIPTKERLEWVIFRLLVFEGIGWYFRYYESTPKATPALNIISVDNEIFILGSFYGSATPGEKITDVSIKNQNINQLLTDYWNNLWLHAKPLNEGNRINWDELLAIATKLGMEREEFNTVVKKWKNELQKRK